MNKDQEYWMQVRRDIEDEPKTDWIQAVVILGNIFDEDTGKVGIDEFWELELYKSHCTAGNYWDTEEDF